MKIIFMGTPDFAANILETLIKNHEVVLVVTQPDKPVGRKKILMKSEVKEVALKHDIEIHQPFNLKKDYEKLLNIEADLIVTAAYGQMLPKELLDKFKAINVHGSILPDYRGGAPIQYALFDGLTQTGVTIMWMAPKMDSGNVIKFAYVSIASDDNYETLALKLSNVGAKTLIEVLETYEKQNFYIESTPQDHSKATFAYNIKRIEEFVDFRETSKEIINRLRGLMPNIGISIKVTDHFIKIYELKSVSDIIEDVGSGTIIIKSGRIVIKSSDGFLEILKIQAPGKKIMSVKDFLNGQKILETNQVLSRKEDINV